MGRVLHDTGVSVTSSRYAIHGGRPGRERLRVLNRVTAETTDELLRRVGIGPRARCLDVGCGGGDVTAMLARLAPDGFVVGTDTDQTVLSLARAEAADAGLRNVEFRREDITRPADLGAAFDVIYARFVLTHLADPGDAVTTLRRRLTPGGVLIVEDIDFTGHFCYPPSGAFQRFVALYSRVVRARGADPDIGPRLPGLLAAAGLDDVGVRVVQPAGFSGDVAAIAPLTLEAIAASLQQLHLASPEEIDGTVRELWALVRDGHTLISLPRIVQCWGRAEGS
jgi:SAM-dependent methyltransferase